VRLNFHWGRSNGTGEEPSLSTAPIGLIQPTPRLDIASAPGRTPQKLAALPVPERSLTARSHHWTARERTGACWGLRTSTSNSSTTFARAATVFRDFLSDAVVVADTKVFHNASKQGPYGVIPAFGSRAVPVHRS